MTADEPINLGYLSLSADVQAEVEAHASRAVTAPVLPDRTTDPAGFLLAACDLRERRIEAATAGTWEAFCPGSEGWEVREVVPPTVRRRRRIIAKLRGGTFEQDRADAEHIAAEANPAHALAGVALWRGIAGRHAPIEWPPSGPALRTVCVYCSAGQAVPALYPCADLALAVDAAAAYLTGAGQ